MNLLIRRNSHVLHKVFTANVLGLYFCVLPILYRCVHLQQGCRDAAPMPTGLIAHTLQLPCTLFTSTGAGVPYLSSSLMSRGVKLTIP